MIGGFPRIKFRIDKHENYYNFNTARSALLALLKSLRINKVHLPNYICADIFTALRQYNIHVEFYEIDEYLYPKHVPNYCEDELVIVVNYFGILNLQRLAELSHTNCVLDATHNFLSATKWRGNAINSWRKYYPVPNGATLFVDSKIKKKQDELSPGAVESSDEVCFDYLFYNETSGKHVNLKGFKRNEKILSRNIIAKPSNYSEYFIQSIDKGYLENVTTENYGILNELFSKNIFTNSQPLSSCSSPLYFPLLCEEINFDALYENSIYVPRLWADFGVSGMHNEFYYNKLLILPLMEKLSVQHIECIKENCIIV